MQSNEDEVKIKIENLHPRSRRVNTIIKVISKNPVREIVSRRDGATHRVTEALVGDETGAILLTLWDNDIEKINESDILNINNGYVSLFRGSMRLNIGKYGTFSPSETSIQDVNTDNNLSERRFEEERRYRDFRQFSSTRRNGDRRGGRRRY